MEQQPVIIAEFWPYGIRAYGDDPHDDQKVADPPSSTEHMAVADPPIDERGMAQAFSV